MHHRFSFSKRCLARISLVSCAGLSMAHAASANSHYLVRQTTTADCGPAALATLLNFYLDTPTTEREVAKLSAANEYGTTFAGLEYATNAKGAGAESFRMTLLTLQQQLESYPAPVLVRLMLPQPHFVLVLGIDKDTVQIADPGSGNVLMPQDSFTSRWLIGQSNEGYVLVAARDDGRANVPRRNQILAELQQGKERLQAQRPAVVMRR